MLYAALVLTLLTPLLHATVLISGDLSVQQPISGLSQSHWGVLHSVSLMLFAIAHLLVTVALGTRDSGWFWPIGRAALGLAGLVLVYVMVYFAITPVDVLLGPGANDPLWLVATLIGFAMGLFQPGFSRLSPTLARLNLICLVVWIALIPAILLIGELFSLGVYERMVGAVYVAWMAAICVALLRRSSPPPTPR